MRTAWDEIARTRSSEPRPSLDEIVRPVTLLMIEVRFIGSKPVADAARRLYQLLEKSYQAGREQDDEAADKTLAEAAYAF
jgi:hypothetical protein